MKKLTIGRGIVHAVAYSADGRWLVSLNSRRALRFWDLGTFAERLSLRLPSPSYWDDHGMLALQEDRLVRDSEVFDIGPCWQSLREPARGRQGKKRGDASFFRAVALEDQGEKRKIVPDPSRDHLLGVVFRQWGRLPDRIVRWDRNGKVQQRIPLKGTESHFYVHRLALGPDGNTLALTGSYSRAPTTILYDLGAKEVRARLEHTDYPFAVAFSPDGKHLATTAGRSVWLWDVAAGQAITRFPAFRRYAEAVAFHPAGRLLAAGGRDGEVQVYDADAVRPVVRFDWDIGTVHGLAFAPDGMTAAAAGHDGAIAVWDLE
jgi:WD40 repeat protein